MSINETGYAIFLSLSYQCFNSGHACVVILGKSPDFEINKSSNSHGTSWQWTAKILENAHNDGNEHDSSKIAQETPPEI